MFAKQRLIFMVFALLSVGCATRTTHLHVVQTSSSAAPLGFYQIQRAASPISVDGILDEFSWQLAEQIDGFQRILNDYDRILHQTRAKMLWDDEYFYFGFACRDPDIWAIFTQEDDPMWSEEVVEVFIDPDGDGENYLELEVNPLNAVVDLKIHHLRPEWKSSIDWDIAGLQTAVQVQGTVDDSLSQDLGWTVEIAIPWTAMDGQIGGGGVPLAGDNWRLNLYRIERQGGRALKQQIDDLMTEVAPLREQVSQLFAAADTRDEEDLGPAQREQLEQLRTELEPYETLLEPLQEHYHQQTEYTAWSETFQRGFHHPDRFGVVQFAP